MRAAQLREQAGSPGDILGNLFEHAGGFIDFGRNLLEYAGSIIDDNRNRLDRNGTVEIHVHIYSYVRDIVRGHRIDVDRNAFRVVEHIDGLEHADCNRCKHLNPFGGIHASRIW